MLKNKKPHKRLAHKMKVIFLPISRKQVLIAVGVIGLSAGGYAYWIQKQNELIIPQLPKPPSDSLYLQADQPIDARVDNLLSLMTLEEKLGQMALVDKNSLKSIDDIKTYSLGAVLSGAGAKPAENTAAGWRTMIEEMKAKGLESRLGIPIFYGVDANHGHANVPGATVFPHAIGLGATNNPDLVKDVARVTADELRATGVNWNYSPSLDAPKDMRWGRVYEAFSDDPALNGILGAAYVAGTQEQPQDKVPVISSVKHFLGTGSMVWGRSNHRTFKIDQGEVEPDETALQEEYIIPYKNAVDQDVASVMVALTDWGNGRIIENKRLVTDLLKEDLGFKGFVVSDWYGVYEYARSSNYRANVHTINAGLDMAMLPYDYISFIRDVRKAVHKGDIKQERIDDAVRRILYQKFKAGLFEKTTNLESLAQVGADEHRLLARDAAAQSAVLLKNNNVLPLNSDNGTILVAGSGADNVGRQSGAWTAEWQGIDGNWLPGSTSIVRAMRNATENTSTTLIYDKAGNFSGLQKKATVGIAIVSEKPYAEGHGDNPNPRIDKADLEAIENLKQQSEKIVVVILSGRPLLISEHIESWDAVVAAWLPGSEGGGISDVLFGRKPFTGTLPLTWPATIEQVPIQSNGATANNTPPLFKRGHGLR